MRKQLSRLVWAAVLGLLAACALVVMNAGGPVLLVGGVYALGMILGMVALSAWRLEKHLGQGIGELGRGLGALVKLDLSVRSTVKADDEISKALKQYNASAWELSGAVKSARSAAHQVNVAAAQLDSGVAQLGRVATQQDAALEGIATALGLAREAAGGTETQAAASDHAAQMIAHRLGSAVAGVTDLAGQAETLGKAMEALRGVVDQLGLLALNTAIEAARAGDKNKRVGMIAEDLKKLAQVAETAGGELDGVVQQVQSSMGSATSALGEMQGLVRRLNSASAPVVQAVARQRQILGDIAAALVVCKEQWPDVAKRVEEAQGARLKLAEQSAELGRQTERFKV